MQQKACRKRKANTTADTVDSVVELGGGEEGGGCSDQIPAIHGQRPTRVFRNGTSKNAKSRRFKHADRVAKRKLMAQPEMSRTNGEQLMREREGPDRGKLRWCHTRKPSACTLAGSLKRVLLQTLRCCQRWWDAEAVEFSVRRIW